MSDIKKRDEQLRTLRAAGWTLAELAEKYDLNSGHIGRICKTKGVLDDPEDTSKMQGLKDTANYARKRCREGLRNENIIRRCSEIALQETNTFRPAAVPKFKRRKDAIQETLTVLYSDGHHDQVVRAEEVNGLEHHTFPVTLRRGERFVDTIIKFAKQTLVGYDFRKLVVLSLGDSTSGEIHDAERHSAFGNQFKNCLAIGAFQAAMFRDLAGHFPEVEIHCTSGNHGRRTTRKEYKGGPHNNWDYMVSKQAQQHLRDQENVKFFIPDSWDTIVDIEGFNFHASHGDDVSASGGNPWNGLQSLHKTNSGIHRGSGANQPFCDAREIDFYAIGHYHTMGGVDGNGVGFLCNGAWPGTDSYAYQSLRCAGRPQQMMFGVHKNHGKTWSLPIHLDGRDLRKTCRYDGVLDSVDGLDYTLNAPRIAGSEGWL